MARQRANLINREDLNLLHPPHMLDRYALGETNLGRSDPRRRTKLCATDMLSRQNEFIINNDGDYYAFNRSTVGQPTLNPLDFGTYQWRLHLYTYFKHYYIREAMTMRLSNAMVALMGNQAGDNGWIMLRGIPGFATVMDVDHLGSVQMGDTTYVRVADCIVKMFFNRDDAVHMLADYPLLRMAEWRLDFTPDPDDVADDDEEEEDANF
jgi:hypothetical protein